MWGRNQISIREPVQSAFVPNTFLVASARRDERESGESCPGDETRGKLTLDICPLRWPIGIISNIFPVFLFTQLFLFVYATFFFVYATFFCLFTQLFFS